MYHKLGAPSSPQWGEDKGEGEEKIRSNHIESVARESAR